MLKSENYPGAKLLLGASDDDFLERYAMYVKSQVTSAISNMQHIQFKDGNFYLSDEVTQTNEPKEILDGEELYIPDDYTIFKHDLEDALFEVLSGGGTVQDIVVAVEEFASIDVGYKMFYREDLPYLGVIRYLDENNNINEKVVQ